MLKKLRDVVLLCGALLLISVLATCGEKSTSKSSSTEDGRILLQNTLVGDASNTIKATLTYGDIPPVITEVGPGEKKEISGGLLKAQTEVSILLESGGGAGYKWTQFKLTINGNVTVRVTSLGGRGETAGIRYTLISE